MPALNWPESFAIGMPVYDVAGDRLGTLVDRDPDCLIVEHGFFFPTDELVPLGVIDRIDADGVWLSLTKAEVRQAA